MYVEVYLIPRLPTTIMFMAFAEPPLFYSLRYTTLPGGVLFFHRKCCVVEASRPRRMWSGRGRIDFIRGVRGAEVGDEGGRGCSSAAWFVTLHGVAPEILAQAFSHAPHLVLLRGASPSSSFSFGRPCTVVCVEWVTGELSVFFLELVLLLCSFEFSQHSSHVDVGKILGEGIIFYNRL